MPLPEFSSPPIVEVAFSIQFEDLPGLNAPRIGAFWERSFRKNFPETRVQPPLEPIFERFGQPDSMGEVSFRLSNQPTPNRVWLMHSENSQVIQVQQNRFGHNWRKVEGQPYPRYEAVKNDFEKEFKTFKNYVSQEKLGDVIPTQFELTYVNHICPGEHWSDHGDFDKIFTGLTKKHQAGDLIFDDFETVDANFRFVIKDQNKPIGRLHAKMSPIFFPPDNEPRFSFILTARGFIDTESAEKDMARFFDLGHEMIVNTFAALTSQKMHQVWGRQ